MNFFKKICVVSFCLIAFNAFAYSFLTTKVDSMENKIKISSFSDYFPFGYGVLNLNEKYDQNSVIKDALLKTFPDKKHLFEFLYYEKPSAAVLAMNEGKLHVFLGAFYATETFNNLDFIFPSILNNPVHLMMLPDKISKVHQTSDLKNLKGVYVSTESFSDYMIKTFQELNMTPVENVDKAYEQLLIGEADFILGSYYFHYAQVLQRGLKGFIAFSTKPLWNMPMFLALSTRIDDRKVVREYFRRMALNETFKENILQSIKDTIKKVEEKSVGTVPPMYVRSQQEGELTPAEERTKEAEK